MVYGTGWDATGIWNYFASFYGHAWLWQGNGQQGGGRALRLCQPRRAACWTGAKSSRCSGEPYKKVGDMPHNWASAEFIRLTVHLLALDRGDELHLLEGMPAQWLGPGMVTRLNGIATPFGPLYLTVQVRRTARRPRWKCRPLAANCKAIVVHLPDGSTSRLAPQQGGTMTFAVP